MIIRASGSMICRERSERQLWDGASISRTCCCSCSIIETIQNSRWGSPFHMLDGAERIHAAGVRIGLVRLLSRRPVYAVQGDLNEGGRQRADYISWLDFSGSSKRQIPGPSEANCWLGAMIPDRGSTSSRYLPTGAGLLVLGTRVTGRIWGEPETKPSSTRASTRWNRGCGSIRRLLLNPRGVTIPEQRGASRSTGQGTVTKEP